MEAATATIHPEGLAVHPEPQRDERLVGWMFVATGLTLFAAMGLLGLAMRLTQADVLGISPEWFYRLMTLHGAGMLTGAMLAMMGGLWFVVRALAPLNLSRMLFSYASILVGAVAIVIAVLIGGFATGWTFLFPLPFNAAGQWSSWATATFLGGLALVGIGFNVFCVDVLSAVTRAHGGLAGALGINYLRGRGEPPPPSVLAAAAVSTQGLLAATVGTTIIFTLIGRLLDSGAEIDALWAKNLTYFFGHSFANLIIYLGAGMVYMLVPRYTGRQWKTTKPVAIAWLATLLLVTIAYSHHLYMDFVQPVPAQIISTVASSAAAIPVAVVTIYTAMMLVWGSRYRWTLASTLLYLGFAGWAIGGTGAVIDSLIPVNSRFHNTLWVPAHFHTYLMLGVGLWMMALLVHMLEGAAGRPAPRWATIGGPAAMIAGGYGLVGAWYASGALGIPRRLAVHPDGTQIYSVVASASVIVFAAGFLIVLAASASLTREALRRRRQGSAPRSQPAPIAGGAPESAAPLRPLLDTPLQIGAAVAVATVAAFAFLPEVRDASEASVQFHHLAHAVQFLLGAALGAALGSTPRVVARLAPRGSNVGMAAVILAPAAMLLLMVPGIYDSLNSDGAVHGLYHIGVAALGLITGLGAAMMGRVPGRLLLPLSVAMTVMYAAGVTGG